jgi:hypothetical protein
VGVPISPRGTCVIAPAGGRADGLSSPPQPDSDHRSCSGSSSTTSTAKPRRLRAARVRQRQDQAHQDAPEHARGSAAGEGGRGAQSATDLGQPNPVSERGGRIDFRIFGRKHWRPAQIKAGIEPVRGLYDLRHTYATFALRAGVPVFAVSRFIGSSIAMIDRHYGHLAHDSREHAVALMDALALERAVDAAWTSSGRPANVLSNSDSRPHRRRNRQRVDARWTPKLVLVASADNKNS